MTPQPGDVIRINPELHPGVHYIGVPLLVLPGSELQRLDGLPFGGIEHHANVIVAFCCPYEDTWILDEFLTSARKIASGE